MLQHFFAAIPWPKLVGLLVALLIAFYGWLKRKVIEAAWKGLTNALTQRLWSWVHRKTSEHAPMQQKPGSDDSNHRTYKGTFGGYFRNSNPPHGHFFTINHDGITSKVPVVHTQLLVDLNEGDLVEIDTRSGVYFDREAVQRVRKINRGAQSL